MSVVLGVGAVAYLVVAAFALALCVGELLANRTADPLSLAGAALASAFWPATLAGILCAAQFSKRQVRRRDDPLRRTGRIVPRA